MVTGSLARRYARALMSIGVDNNNYEQLGRELGSLAAAMRSSEELSNVLTSSSFTRDERRNLLEAILARLGASTVTRNFCLLLLDGERIGAVPDISRELDAMIDERVGRTTAEVVSASPMSPAQVEQLQAVLERLSGKKVQLERREDPELLGGVVAKVGDLVYDGSLRTQLELMREGLVE